MGRIYSIDELLALRRSPLVQRPSSLRPLEEWIGTAVEDSRPKTSTKSRNTTQNSIPATRYSESKTAKDNSLVDSSKYASTTSTSSSERVRVSVDREARPQNNNILHQHEDQSISLRPFNQEKVNNWGGSRKTVAADSDEILHRFVPQTNSSEIGGRRKEGYQMEEGGSGNQRPSSAAHARAHNWRTAAPLHRETQRPSSRMIGYDKQHRPDWFKDDILEDNGGDEEHTAADVEAWKTIMKRSQIQESRDDNHFQATAPNGRKENQSTEKPRKFRAPLSVETSRDGFYDTLDAAVFPNQSIASEITPSDPSHEGMPRSSRFTTFFGPPKPSVPSNQKLPPQFQVDSMTSSQPVAPVPDTNRFLSSIPSQQADRAGFERILQMLGSPRPVPDSSRTQPGTSHSSTNAQSAPETARIEIANSGQNSTSQQPLRQFATSGADFRVSEHSRNNGDSEYLLSLLRSHGSAARPPTSELHSDSSQNLSDRHGHRVNYVKDGHPGGSYAGKSSYQTSTISPEIRSTAKTLDDISNRDELHMKMNKNEHFLVPRYQNYPGDARGLSGIHDKEQSELRQHLPFLTSTQHSRAGVSGHLHLE